MNENPEDEAYLKALGTRIKAMRKARKLTLRQMDIEHGYSLANWQRLERGVGITLRTLLRVSRIFCVSPGEMLAGLESESGPSVPLP